MKKRFHILLALTMIFGLLGSQIVSAAPVSQKPTSVTQKPIVINEYQYIKDFAQKSPTELKGLGFNEKEIVDVPNMVNQYKEELQKRSKLSTEDLKVKGYTDPQISTLKAFNGSEDQLQSLSATLTIEPSAVSIAQPAALTSSVGISRWLAYYYFDSALNKTVARITASWSWSSEPICEFTDSLAFSWSGGFIQDSAYDGANNYNRVTYRTSLGYTDTYYSWYCVPGSGCSGNFPVRGSYGGSAAWAQSGYGTVTVFKANSVSPLALTVAYGHSIVTVVPSISTTGSGGLSFNPSTVEVTSSYTVNNF